MKRYDTDVMAGLVIPAKPAWTACDAPYRDCAQTADAAPFTYLMPRVC
jgi:hypothetical protein